MALIAELSKLHPGPPIALTIGVFDGVHRGHQALITHAVQRAQALGGQSAAITFHPHPRAVLAPDTVFYDLTSLDERLALIAQLGVNIVIPLAFTLELSRLSPEEFLDLVQEHLNLRELWVGPDFALGYRRAGTVPRLSELGAERGFSVGTVPPVAVAGGRVSSSRVRDVIVAGDVEQARLLLGRLVRLEGVVVAGVGRGRRLGFPTANLALTSNYLLPANGIYAVYAELGGNLLPAVANIGVRPTFGGNERLVEVYILDFDREIYGWRLRVHLIKRLREEMRFAAVADLVARMERDVSEARAVFAAEGSVA